MRYKLPDGNMIVAEQDFIDAHYPGAIATPEQVMLSNRRVSKLSFVGRLGTDYRNILVAAKTNVDIEMFVKMLDWATPDADGTSVDLDDPRVVGALHDLESASVIATGRAAEILV